MKTRSEESGKAVPHTALIYTDRQERNRLIHSCLKDAKIGRCWVLVRTCQPESDTKYFRGRAKHAVSRGVRFPPSVIDIREAVAGARPAEEIVSFVKRERRRNPEGESLLVIGDWMHSVYDRFNIALDVEETEREMSNLLCCYRAEGFWSLPPAQIARVFELHRRVLFGSVVLEMPVRKASARRSQRVVS